MENVRRWQFMEVVMQWDGELTASRLCEYFGVSRTTAQKVISDYQIRHPANMADYNPKQKAHTPSQSFTPHYTKGELSEYLRFFSEPVHFDTLSSSSCPTNLELLPSPIRNERPELIRAVIQACKHQRRLDIGYYSVSSGVNESRIISPHTLVFDGMRWHTRAYCERSKAFRDFVLSRFHEEPVFEDRRADKTKADDTEWNQLLTLNIQPDPRLNAAQRKAIELDYRMDQGQCVIECRAALIKYLLQKLRLDHYHHNPEGQQIIVEPECWHRIEPYRLK